MPRYEFECNQCKVKFDLFLTIKGKETAKIVCPECNSQDVAQIYSGINIHTNGSKKTTSNGCCGGNGCC